MHPTAAWQGERRLLYCCFLGLFGGANSPRRTGWSSFLYLQLKLQFRSEMIQVNGQVGFANFADYEVRKGELLGRNCYWVRLPGWG